LPADVVFDNVTINNTLTVLGQIVDTGLSSGDIVWTASGGGTLTTTPGTVGQNQFYAGPVSGGSGAASWRALDNADIPSVLVGQIIENATIYAALVNESISYQSSCSGCALAGGTNNTGNTISGGTLSGVALAGNTTNTGNFINGGTIAGATLINIAEIENATLVYSVVNNSIFYSGTWNGGTIAGATLTGTTTLGGLSASSVLWTDGASALTTSAAAQSANAFYAGPSSGSAAAPTWRSITSADLPSVISNITLNGTVTVTSLIDTGLSNNALVWTDGSHTLTTTGAAQSANTVFAGPSASPSAAPTFRSLGLMDLPAQTGTGSIVLSSGPSISGATLSGTTTLSGLSTSSVLWTSGASALTTSAAAQSANAFYAGPSSGSAAAPTWRAITSADLPTVISNITLNGTVTVTSLIDTGLSTHAIVWTDGSKTLTTTATSQSANTVYAGPTNPPSSAPTFRSLVLADLPTQTGTGSIVLSSGPTISGATLSGTTTLSGLSTNSVLWASSSGPALTTSAAAQSANAFYAGPSSGSAAAPTWRSITSADLPPVISNITLNGTVTVTSLTITGLSSNALIWTNDFNVLTTTSQNQNANLVYAGPVSAPSGPPTFRSLVLADLPTQTGSGNIVLATGPSISGATLSGTTTLTGLSTNSVLWTSSSGPALTTSAAAQSANTFYAGPGSGSAAAPTWRAITSADLSAALGNFTLNGTVTVTNLTVTGLGTSSLVWTDGAHTLTTTGAAQSANTVLAGPASSPSAAPTFRALGLSDLPAQTGTGNIVLSTGPSISGATLSGTTTLSSLSASSVVWTDGSSALTSTAAAQSANTFYAGPSASPAAAPTWRAITSADLPALTCNASYSGTLNVTSLTVTSLSTSSLVWTDATSTLTTTGAAQSANTVYAGPAAAPSAAPTFRSLVLADLPAQTGSGNIVLSTSPTLVTPALGTPTSCNLASCTGYPASAVSGGTLISWTPTMGDGTHLVSVNAGVTVAAYKYLTADQIWFSAALTWTSLGSASGNVRLAIPVVSNAFGSTYRYPTYLGLINGINTATVGQVTSGIDAGNNYTWLLKSTSGTGAVAQFSDLSSTGTIQWGGVYPI
jgi:hypothetical protein